MSEAQKVGAQTNAVIKSTGGAANVSAKQVDALAESLLKKSGVDDEVIKSGENMLLTFTNIRNEQGKGNKIFDQATKATLDFGRYRQGHDQRSRPSRQGIERPEERLTALRRVGVQFTDAQEDQIKALVKSGKMLEAQKIILRELQKEFGGSARRPANPAGQAQHPPQHALERRRDDRAEAHTGDHQGRRQDRQLAEQDEEPREDHQRLRDGSVDPWDDAEDARTVFETLSKIVGGNKNAIKLLVGAYATFKVLTIANNVGTLAASMWGLRNKTLAANTQARLLNSNLGKIAGRGVIPVAIALSIYFAGKYARQAANWLAGTEFGKKHKWVGGGTVAATGAQAARLRGMSPSDRFEALSRMKQAQGGDTYNFYGIQDLGKIENEVLKRQKRRNRRRG